MLDILLVGLGSILKKLNREGGINHPLVTHVLEVIFVRDRRSHLRGGSFPKGYMKKKSRIKNLDQMYTYIYLDGVRDDTGVLGVVMRLLQQHINMETRKDATFKFDTYPRRGGVCGHSSSSMDMALNQQCYQLHAMHHCHRRTSHLFALLVLTTLLASSSLDILILSSGVS